MPFRTTRCQAKPCRVVTLLPRQEPCTLPGYAQQNYPPSPKDVYDCYPPAGRIPTVTQQTSASCHASNAAAAAPRGLGRGPRSNTPVTDLHISAISFCHPIFHNSGGWQATGRAMSRFGRSSRWSGIIWRRPSMTALPQLLKDSARTA